ncbi:DUF5074 domain-containing protein [Chitinophaga sp. Hz27]|uniref:DUF5074 domain-containing protein n=1 Tax=Chitinophaga sp. Hz27 TaxID=3347169 RepID=UPI0035DFC130
MRKISRSLQFPLVLVALAMMGITACQKNEAGITVPAVVSPGLNNNGNGNDTIYIGDSRTIRPQLGNVTGTPTYQWLVNGVEKGTDSTFTFKPTERGDYTISFKVFSGNSLSGYYYRIKVLGPWENGFYIVNEGNWPSTGELNFYRNGADSVYQNIYGKVNAGKQLGVTSEYGAIYNGLLYIVSKQGPLVIADAYNLLEKGRTAPLPAEGHAFCGVDNSRGLVSTTDGVYIMDLNSFTLTGKVNGITGEAGSMLKSDNYVFVLTANDGVVVLNASDLSVVNKPVKASVGFAKSRDGRIWAGEGKNLYAIDGGTLAVQTYPISFDIYSTWGFWNAGSFCASRAENAIFFAQTGQYGGGSNVYKFVPGIDSTLTVPIVKLPADRELYGAGVRYNPIDTTLVITAMKPGYGVNSKENTLFIYNAVTGALKKSVPYSGYFFPAMPVLN